ncbi:CRIB domain-containing protein RIC4 [Dendrobium catenatum]|uniref:CRIB domain-containing protein n=1 Tax=Dendrobium catenatum TaxID=906689 RepID=A0A2I0WIC9_9ASPA|nr:CRIB domain-containing protein RIC4 [Dendrobium catenatum]PKU75424.1 hypothetical protein MA16_Dca026153 [Dendrobium catenatum]
MALKERVQRFVILPFSVGCASHSSVKVIEKQSKNTHIEQDFFPEDEGRGGQESGRTKSTSSIFLQLPRPIFSAGIHKLAKGFKNLSNLFSVYKDNDEEDEAEMDIGYPTDVQHVAHIGWDGFNNVGGMKGWEKAPEFFPLSSLSLKQFELAMASQAEGCGPL